MAGPASPEVWICDLGACGSRLIDIGRTRDLLTESESRRAAAIVDVAARERWIAAHVALHLALEPRVGRPVKFVSSPERGISKPRVAGWSGDFSLAHSGDLVLVAISERGPIGIDVEIRRETRLDDRRRCVIEAAGEAIVAAPSPPRTDAALGFLANWTRLEAVAKARGDGIGAVLEAIGLHAPDASQAAAAARRLLGEGTNALAVYDIDVARFDAVAALAQPAIAPPPAIRNLSDLTS